MVFGRFHFDLEVCLPSGSHVWVVISSSHSKSNPPLISVTWTSVINLPSNSSRLLTPGQHGSLNFGCILLIAFKPTPSPITFSIRDNYFTMINLWLSFYLTCIFQCIQLWCAMDRASIYASEMGTLGNWIVGKSSGPRWTHHRPAVYLWTDGWISGSRTFSVLSWNCVPYEFIGCEGQSSKYAMQNYHGEREGASKHDSVAFLGHLDFEWQSTLETCRSRWALWSSTLGICQRLPYFSTLSWRFIFTFVLTTHSGAKWSWDLLSSFIEESHSSKNQIWLGGGVGALF